SGVKEAKVKIIDSSVKSIMSVTLSVVLSTISINVMFLIDRSFLAGYSVNSMNAACISGNFVAMLGLFFIGITGAAGVFVGQYNGSKQYNMLAAPVWQMIYFSLASIPLFLLLGYFSPYINLLPEYFLKDGIAYQQTLMYFAFLSPLRVAFSAFFTGQGKTEIIACSAIVGAVTNIVLDYVLIFGYSDIIPSLGCKGAAIATNISDSVQVITLATIFFSRKNREKFKILESRGVNFELFKGCYRIGLPMSVGHFVIMLAWYVLQTIIGYTSQDASTVYNIALNLFMFFFFISGGFGRSATMICANMIGRNDLKSVQETYRFFIILSLFLGFLSTIPLIFFSYDVLSLLNFLNSEIIALYPQIQLALIFVSVAIILETLVSSTFGVLVSGGDAKFGIIVDVICFWGLVIFPTAVMFFTRTLHSAPIIFVFMIFRSTVSLTVLYKRYKSMKWYKKLV
ncbi:MAG: polysaccharide biosynthesis C-terminal domain-containing protein, partial [Alphaproteobacteria bacterium]|nr:polysaccharide biosynthesis C-terminal domain-containing protein [Alphaproteobacteria bacterium]